LVVSIIGKDIVYDGFHVKIPNNKTFLVIGYYLDFGYLSFGILSFLRNITKMNELIAM